MPSNLKSIKKDLLEISGRGKLPSRLLVAEEHYHLRPAGVRVVIENAIDAMISYLPVKELDVFVFSDFENIFTVSDLKIRPAGGKKKTRIHKIDIAGLNYDDSESKSKKEFLRKVNKLKEKILDSIPLQKCSKENPFIFHCHGLSLGKNPYLNAAIKMLAEECLQQQKPVWFLSHVHDFAENSRPEMLQRLQNCTGKHDAKFAAQIMYPNTGNIFYMTINSRDARNLVLAGIARKRVFFLPNSIDTDFFTSETIIRNENYRAQLIEKIREYSSRNHYFFDEKRKILLSPLKVMRRKNNAETILLLMALNYLSDSFQLMITLEPGSGKDIGYAKALKRFIRVNRLPVVIGLGNDLISSSEERKIRGRKVEKFSLVDVFALSEAEITNSIIEGFGFCFHEGWLAGKPIVGRRLPYVCKDFSRNGLRLGHMYKKLWVKLDWIRNAEKRLLKLYYQDVNSLRKRQDLKPVSRNAIKRYVNNVKFYRVRKSKCIDFKDLSLEMQLEAINTIFSSRENKGELIRLNPVIRKIHGILQRKPERLIAHNKRVVMKKYGLEAMARRLQKIFLIGKKHYLGKIRQGKVDNRRVIAKYLDLDYIHPLTVD